MTEEAAYPEPDLPDLVPSPEGGPGLLLDAGPEVVEEQSTASDQDAPAASGATSAEDNFGTLMAQEAPPLDLEPSVRLDMTQTLKGYPVFVGGREEWNAMNASLILARKRSTSPPWKRPKLQKLSVDSIFQEPLLGRYDWAVSAPSTVPDPVPWKWVPQSTYEARRLLAARFAKTDDQLKLAAFKKIRTIVLMFPEDSELGRSLLGVAGTFIEEDALMTTLEDAFSGKAEGTLLKRATDFCRFAQWAVKHKLRPLAPAEGDVYAYLVHLRKSGASASSGESFLKAYRFFCHLAGAAAPRVAARSEGVAKSLAGNKRPLWQAPELSVKAVTALERFCHDSTDAIKISVGGFTLFCAYSSSRWSDAARAGRIKLDTSSTGLTLLEAETLHYKTRAKDRKNKVLPLIALGNGLTQPAWATSWMKARDKLGMHNLPFLMPGLSASNNFLNRPMSAAEGTLWLREILYMQGVDEDLERYSSHSLKATCLSWSAKSCTMTYEERLTQGHHVSPKHGMALLYSRDALAEILVKLARVVKAIEGRSFQPDLPRAERVAAALADDPSKYVHLPETKPDDREVEEPEMENNSEAGTDLSDAAELLVPDPLCEPPEVKPRVENPLKGKTWVHVLSGVTHSEVTPGFLRCGRKITVNMRAMEDFEVQSMVCQQCATSQ